MVVVSFNRINGKSVWHYNRLVVNNQIFVIMVLPKVFARIKNCTYFEIFVFFKVCRRLSEFETSVKLLLKTFCYYEYIEIRIYFFIRVLSEIIVESQGFTVFPQPDDPDSSCFFNCFRRKTQKYRCRDHYTKHGVEQIFFINSSIHRQKKTIVKNDKILIFLCFF